MILTWLWKMLQWFRQSHAAPLLEAPKGPGRLGETPDFINTSNDANNARVVVFEGDETPPASPGR